MQVTEVYNLPDIQFVRWCEKTFMINRGVYNTIDEKLYNQGFTEIRERRKHIVLFLQQHIKTNTEKKFYKFGPGNLSDALEKYV